MKASIARDELRAALKVVAPAIPRRAHNPALMGALIEVAGDTVTATATDLDRTIRRTTGARVDTAGDLVVPHGVLRRIIDACGAGAVELQTDDTQLLIEGGDGLTASVDLLVRSEFPDLAGLRDNATTVQIDTELRTVLRRALAAVSHDDTRPVLTGVWLHEDGLISSADSYIGTHTPTDYTLPDVTIPGSTLADVLRIATEDLTMVSDGDRVEFHANGTTWTAMCIQGDRPDVGRLIPDKSGEILTVALEDLGDALGSVSAIEDDPGQSAAAVTITANADTMTLRKVSRGVGEVSRSIDCETVAGLDNAMGLNPRNLAKIVGVLDCETVDLDTHGASKPTVIRDGDTTHIIMPVRNP